MGLRIPTGVGDTAGEPVDTEARCMRYFRGLPKLVFFNQWLLFSSGATQWHDRKHGVSLYANAVELIRFSGQRSNAAVAADCLFRLK